jgi:hypothetical protein
VAVGFGFGSEEDGRTCRIVLLLRICSGLCSGGSMHRVHQTVFRRNSTGMLRASRGRRHRFLLMPAGGALPLERSTHSSEDVLNVTANHRKLKLHVIHEGCHIYPWRWRRSSRCRAFGELKP